LMIILNSFEFQFQMHPVHKIFGVLMVLSGSLHLYLNFGSVKKYLNIKKMALFTGVLSIIMVLLYGVGINKPLNIEKIKQMENIAKTLEE